MIAQRAATAILVLGLFGTANATTFAPDPVLPSKLTVQIEEIVQVAVPSNRNNFASPIPIHGDLYAVNQRGEILRRNGADFDTVFTLADAPPGVVLEGAGAIVNMAAGRSAEEVFVVFRSQTLPPGGYPQRGLPPPLPGLCCDPPMLLDDLYRINGPDSTIYQMIYKYTLDGGTLTMPVPVAAFETQSGNGAHSGGGILTLPNGKILFATGDSLPPGTDGRGAAQDPLHHVSKLLLVDPDTGASETAALGVRNVQQLQFADPISKTSIVFADIGGVTAEEINEVAVSDLQETSVAENFGWGRNPDGMAREGTFYVGPGIAQTTGEPGATGPAPVMEPGFIQPFAQFGRAIASDPIAATGPAISEISFDRITSLFGDLALGGVFATIDPLGSVNVPVYTVNLITPDLERTSLLELSGFNRADPRFFQFTDGTAGVLLERAGKIYRLTEVAPIPLPASALLFAVSLGLLGGVTRKKRSV